MYEYKCIVKRIVDGDTIVVDIDLGFGVWMKDQHMRLNGVDTPEKRTSDLVEKAFGLYATAYVEAIMVVGSEYTIITSKNTTGKYGRILADFKLDDGSFLCENILRDGVGVEWDDKKIMVLGHLLNRKRLIREGLVNIY